MVRNLHWYNANTARDYPLADQATAKDHAGGRLPTHILADLNLRFPDSYGTVAFISAVAVTENLVSVLIQAAADESDTTSFVPLAVVSLPQPVIPWRHYALSPQSDGVGGWIVFGEGIAEAYTGRFTVAAGLLCPRAARAYRPLPVRSVSKLSNAQRLSGLILLQAESPLELVGETRTIEGVEQTVGILRLVQSADNAATNVFEEFAGPCGKRAETGNCGDPVPIEYLNAVQPDCNGNLIIEFSGCARLGIDADGHGVVVDCRLNLADACIGDNLPASDGVLANEYVDQCEDSWYSESVPYLSLPSETFGSDSEISQMLSGGGMTWPLWYTFDLGIASEWRIARGAIGFGTDASYSWQPQLGSSGAYTGQQAAYISTDLSTKGSWLGTYGIVGYAIPGSTIHESFATGLFTGNAFASTCTGIVNTTYETATGANALQMPPSGSTRTAAYWANDPGSGTPDSFDFDLAFIDAQQHDVSFYFLAYDNVTRTQTVEIMDLYSLEVLYSNRITLNTRQNNAWLHYRVKGGIKVRITRDSGPDAVLNAVLLDQHLAYAFRSLSSFESGGVRSIYHVTEDNLILHQLTDSEVATGKTIVFGTFIAVGGDQFRSELVLNYHTSSITGKGAFYSVGFDTDTDSIEIKYVDGDDETVLASSNSVEVPTGKGLQGEVSITETVPGETVITFRGWSLVSSGPPGSAFEDLSAPATSVDIGTITITVYDFADHDTGKIGWRANKSAARLMWIWATTWPGPIAKWW